MEPREITHVDREAAAAVAVLPEMRDLILAGKADHHAAPFAAHREAERARIVAAIHKKADVQATAFLIQLFADIANAIERNEV